MRYVYDPAKTLLQRLLLSGILSTEKQHELNAVAQSLDPLRLFHQLEQLQKALLRCTVEGSPFVANASSLPIRVCAVEQCQTEMGGRREHPRSFRKTRLVPGAGEEKTRPGLSVYPQRPL